MLTIFVLEQKNQQPALDVQGRLQQEEDNNKCVVILP